VPSYDYGTLPTTNEKAPAILPTPLMFNTTTITGSWVLTNGYKTAEFLSDIACGQNSCGDTMYCLPVSCTDTNNTACTNELTVLARTAELKK